MVSARPTQPEGQSADRLDVWLDVACLFKTRSEAVRAVNAGKVQVNAQSAKPHKRLRAGDRIEISRAAERSQTVVVRAFAGGHVPKAMASQLYEDLTPPPSPEELEARRIERLLRRAAGPVVTRAPDRRDRRALRRLKGRDA